MHPINTVNLNFCGNPNKKSKKPYAFENAASTMFNVIIRSMCIKAVSFKLWPRLLTQVPSSRYLTLLNLVRIYGVIVNAQTRHNMLPICADMNTVSKIPKHATRFQKLSLLKREIIKFMVGLSYVNMVHSTLSTAKIQKTFAICNLRGYQCQVT
jgi:hypothetical protein